MKQYKIKLSNGETVVVDSENVEEVNTNERWKPKVGDRYYYNTAHGAYSMFISGPTNNLHRIYWNNYSIFQTKEQVENLVLPKHLEVNMIATAAAHLGFKLEDGERKHYPYYSGNDWCPGGDEGVGFDADDSIAICKLLEEWGCKPTINIKTT